MVRCCSSVVFIRVNLCLLMFIPTLSGWEYSVNATVGAWCPYERNIHVSRRARWVRRRIRDKDSNVMEKKKVCSKFEREKITSILLIIYSLYLFSPLPPPPTSSSTSYFSFYLLPPSPTSSSTSSTYFLLFLLPTSYFFSYLLPPPPIALLFPPPPSSSSTFFSIYFPLLFPLPPLTSSFTFFPALPAISARGSWPWRRVGSMPSCPTSPTTSLSTSWTSSVVAGGSGSSSAPRLGSVPSSSM